MDAQQIDIELDDLEVRIDRLRGLYDQYFMGLERVEPQVPRKDIERKIQLLRKEQIRNTGQRFKFNTIVQRYNTMQQHWSRIAREIENGTYKRDVARAAARIGAQEALTAVGRRRAAKYAALAAKAEAEAEARTQGTGPVDQTGVRATKHGTVDEHDEPDAETLRPPAPTTKVVPAAAASVPNPEAGKRRVAEMAAEMKRKREAAAAQRAPTTAELDLDLEAPPSTRRGAKRTTRPPSRKPRSMRPPELVTMPKAAAVPRELRNDLSSNNSSPRPSTPPPRTPPPLPARTATPPPVPSRPGLPPPPVAAQAPGPPPVPSRPNAPPPPMRVAPPPVPSRPNTPPPVARLAPQPSPSGDGDARMRQIYGQYVDAKRANNESTAGITYDKLAKSLAEQKEKLRAQHAGKAVDFEVAVKNGKAVIRPILR